MNGTYVCTLYSSSGGNCMYVRANGKEFLVDVGVQARSINNALNHIGTSLESINAIFITHEHSDHTKGIDSIIKCNRIPVYAPLRSAEKIKVIMPDAADCIIPIKDYSPVVVDDVVFSPFRTPHDSISSCGYVIDTGKIKIGIATDMGYITKKTAEALSSCKAVIIESNHDIEMLETGRYPQTLKHRILGKFGHLSNDTCAAFLPYLVKCGTTSIVLAHLSKENNTPEKAYNTSRRMLEGNGISVCTPEKAGDVYLNVAPRNGVCELINIED